jgi:hypothetical protein
MSDKNDDESTLAKVAGGLTERLQGVVEQIQGTADKVGLGGVLDTAVTPLKQSITLIDAVANQTTIPITQFEALIDAIRAQRDVMGDLKNQIDVFNKQLTALEQTLSPIVGWGHQWMEVQESVLGRVRQGND